MYKKIFLFVSLTALAGNSLRAGDIAVFVDFGFSPDGRTYMFGQYGVQSGTLFPWADLYIVDVAANNFVSGGRISYTHNAAISAGQDGSEVLYRLLAQNAALAERHNVNFLHHGQPLYILPDNGTPDGDTIEFRDFDRNIQFRAKINVLTEGSRANTQGSFFISLNRNGDGGARNYVVGSAAIKRSGISDYKIRKVVTSGNSIIFIVEMKKYSAAGGFDIRYMVEALRL